jgi:serine/threonine protein kinase
MPDPKPEEFVACPSEAELASFLGGELPHLVLEKIGSHLTCCLGCDSTVRRLDLVIDSSSRGVWLDAAAPETDVEPDPAFLRMVEQSKLAITVPLPQVVTSDRPPIMLGQYRLGDRLGRGGMGTVYQAEHLLLKRPVALKLLLPDRTRDPRAVARFRQEMASIGKLSHQNIVTATDAGEVNGVHFLVMELVEGIDLARLVYRCGPLPAAEACEVVRQAAIGLQHAHQAGLLHRDLKPSNLMLSVTGEVKILDFGLARLWSAEGLTETERNEEGLFGLTSPGEVMGTADYMAPEQWDPSHGLDIRADIYSLGCTLYTLLTGAPPFALVGRGIAVAKRKAHGTDTPRPVTERGPHLEEGLGDLVNRMLAKNPDDRPSTPADLAQELEVFAKGADLAWLHGTVTEVISRADRPDRPPPAEVSAAGSTHGPGRTRLIQQRQHRRKPLQRVLVGAILLLVFGGGILAAHLLSPSPPPDTPIDNTPPNPPNGWQNLLARPPQPHRGGNPASTQCTYHASTETVWISSADRCLIPLGETSAQRYMLQIELQQNRWTGGVGVYFGGKVSPKDQIFSCQVIELRKFPGLQNPPTFRLCRAFGDLHLNGPKPPSMSYNIRSTSQELEAPKNGSHCLDLEVEPYGLSSVRWEEHLCTALSSAIINDKFTNIDRDGEFGIFCYKSECSVSKARFRALEESRERR